MYDSQDSKWRAVVDRTRSMVDANRPVLIGTRTVGASERVAAMLRHAGLEPTVLNARQDREEAQIISEAGRAGQVTVATNMAGRGADIKPYSDVLSAGGLHVILTEYHESARIDRQLFGRCGRLGDPGTYECIVALTDDLFQRFGRGVGIRVVSFMIKHSLVPGASMGILRSYCQAQAERQHALTRRFALDDDLRTERAMSFAGKAD